MHSAPQSFITWRFSLGRLVMTMTYDDDDDDVYDDDDNYVDDDDDADGHGLRWQSGQSDGMPEEATSDSLKNLNETMMTMMMVIIDEDRQW